MITDDTSDSNQTLNEVKAESDGTKPKEKKYRCAPPTKVVIRRLPPTMTLEKFIDQVSPLPENDYLHFAKADASLGQHSFCTAYVNFVEPNDVFIFKEKFDDYIFIDNKGNEFPAVVEFAPFQKIPRKKSRQRDPKCGTVDTDSDYLAFVAQMKQTLEDTSSDNGIKSASGGKSSPLLSVQDVLEEIEAKERDRKSRKATTPLIEFIKQRKMERQRMKDEKKEERKRREVERKRAKEEERKHRREANREAIQGKRERERKEQRREGGSRHEDRMTSKHDSGQASKTSSENRQSPTPSGGDVMKQKKEVDYSYDDPDDDEEEDGVDDDEDDADQDLYDQEQTQKLKEILRIGTVCKGSEKGSHAEYSSDVEVTNMKKGAEKGNMTSYERSRGGGDWERGNRSQRMAGSYNEEYHGGARPKVIRSEGGGHERRGGTKEKKQNDQRQYGESRHREKPGKVWLAKNEGRHQKVGEERIRIQKADGERGGPRDEHLADKNASQVKGEDTSEVEMKAISPVSEESGQPPPSSQETTPSSEVEDLAEGDQSEQRSGKDAMSEKSNPEPEGRHKNSASSKGSRDSVSSSNQNTSNGEMRRMRNKVGTSRDSGSLKMIKNKDRPSMEIYRPGMRRFNLQKKEAAETGGTTKSGNTTASNPDSTCETNSNSSGSGYSGMHGTPGNTKGKERDDKRRMSGGRGGGNKRRDGPWKQGDDSSNTRHDRPKGRDDRGRGNWSGHGDSTKSCGDARDRFDDKPIKEDVVEVRSMTFKRSVSRD